METSTIVIALLVVNIAVLVATKLGKKKPGAVTTEGISVDAAQAAITQRRGEKFTLIARFLRGRKDAGLIERNLTTAGMLLKPTEFMVANLIFLIVIVLMGLGYLRIWENDGALFTMLKRLLFILACFLMGWKGPQMILQFLANQRRTKLEYQLADALTIISSSLKGGYSFVQGLDMAGQQMEPPIKDEITRVIRLIQLGLDTPRALLQMSDRVNSYDYDMTISATNIQLAVGGNLSALLEGIANTIRDRIRLRRDIAALTAQGRISGAILVILPMGIAVMLKFINPEYMNRLFDTTPGNNLLYLAGGQQLFGIWWIKNLLNFDK